MEDGLILVCGMSRSGTTLLTTIMDSHPDVSMAYELMPAGLPGPGETLQLVVKALAAEGDDAEACGRLIKEEGEGSLGTFVRRCGRALVPPSELVEVLNELQGAGVTDLNELPARVRLSAAVAERKRAREQTRYAGFKMNSPGVATAAEVLPGARCVYIVRDPRDVVASQIANEFDREIPDITKAWQSYLRKFATFARQRPERTALVRYEDLVSRPQDVLEDVCKQLELDYDAAMLQFFDSKASVHQVGHANAENLRRDFFQTSVDRWRADLDVEQIDAVERACGSLMAEHGYQPAREKLVPIRRKVRAQKAAAFQRKRRYYRDEYARLLEPFLDDYLNLTWGEVAEGRTAVGSDVFMVRHDVDHDLYNALRMARWEHRRGVRATYCMLHTTWYYGTLAGGRMRHTKDLVDVSRQIQKLGHEVILHNNVPVTALREGIDPVRFLRDELAFLRSHGLPMLGSSSHGDKLCREVGVRNYELFAESVSEHLGGRRVVEFEGNAVELGVVPLGDFGFAYEASDIPRDLYMTDSGGNLRTNGSAPGRGGRQRAELDAPPPYGRIVGLLAHPIWWDMGTDAPAGRPLRHWRWPLDAEEPVEIETVAKGRSPLNSTARTLRGAAARIVSR